ncbi:MAG TPA: hypothetical protein PLH64_08275 [Anaerolineaceae bacterium]|jgi:hypothetical protein|nr:hypothetical protein [Anaerolineaceae bacterium]
MPVKVLITWNVIPGREQEYFGYVVGEYLPEVNRLGLDVTDAWVTVFGDHPQVLIGALMPDLPSAQRLIHSPDWRDLSDRLQEFVRDFNLKVVTQRGAFQF